MDFGVIFKCLILQSLQCFNEHMCIRILLHIYESFSHISWNGTICYRGVHFQILLGIAICILKWSYQFTIPPEMREVPIFLPTFGIVWHLNFWQYGWKWYCIIVLLMKPYFGCVCLCVCAFVTILVISSAGFSDKTCLI